MGLTWYMIGLTLGLSTYALFKLYIRYDLKWLPLTLCGSGIGLILFAAAWGVASMLEGVPRSASMGLLLFGLPGIILTTYGARLIAKAKETLTRPIEGTDA